MNRYLPLLIGGAACLPFTYQITQNGTLLLSGLIVVLISLAAYLLSRYFGEVNVTVASVVFVFGVACSSISFYLQWYKVYGYKEEDLSGSQIIWMQEGGLISVLGVLTIFVSSYLVKMHVDRK